jgi:hypothetical protein
MTVQASPMIIINDDFRGTYDRHSDDSRQATFTMVTYNHQNIVIVQATGPML